MAINSTRLFSFILLLAFSTVVVTADDFCIYNLFIQTGSMKNVGTDSNITVDLYDKRRDFLAFPNVEKWGGIMRPGHDYFERGNLDFFSGRAPCVSVCALQLTSDDTGIYPDWYVNHVEAIIANGHGGNSLQHFEVEQWLYKDETADQLSAYRSNCPNSTLNGRNESGRLIFVA